MSIDFSPSVPWSRRGVLEINSFLSSAFKHLDEVLKLLVNILKMPFFAKIFFNMLTRENFFHWTHTESEGDWIESEGVILILCNLQFKLLAKIQSYTKTWPVTVFSFINLINHAIQPTSHSGSIKSFVLHNTTSHWTAHRSISCSSAIFSLLIENSCRLNAIKCLITLQSVLPIVLSMKWVERAPRIEWKSVGKKLRKKKSERVCNQWKRKIPGKAVVGKSIKLKCGLKVVEAVSVSEWRVDAHCG